MLHTTLPKVDKMGTSSAEVPTAQALVARPGSKAVDGNPADNDTDHLNFTTAEFEIICQTCSRLQMCWPDLGKLDCLVWYFGWSSFNDP
jgi:hypothetical protein